MKHVKLILVTIMICTILLSFTSCWNYREIDELAVVSGVAIDRGIHDKYSLTIELVEVGAQKESEPKSKIITTEGKTIFDAIRNGISYSRKRLYWAHTKIIIISQEIAGDGIVSILDWFDRDAEARADIHIAISRESSAKEILTGESTTEKVKSIEIDDELKNQKSLSKTPDVEVWKLVNELMAQGISTIATAVGLYQADSEKVAVASGTAIFKSDKLLGFVDGEETQYILFVKDEVKGGVLVAQVQDNDRYTNVTLEIFKSKTKIEPVIINGNVEINININILTAIDEIEDSKNVINDEGRKELKQSIEQQLKGQIENIIHKIQTEYGTDIFGFGNKLYKENPKVWNTLKDTWQEQFKELKVNVSTDIEIKNSAMLSKTLELGD